MFTGYRTLGGYRTSNYRTQTKQSKRRRDLKRDANRVRNRDLEQLERRTLLAAHVVGDPTVYATIQAAINAAAPNAVVNVDPGNYSELVVINKPLTLRGAMSGVDGRSDQRGTANESVITGIQDPNGPGNASCIEIAANGVTVDGFTVQGNTVNGGSYGAGIVIEPNQSGSTIVNNILQNNVTGLYLANNSTTQQCLIQHNLFFNNNQYGDSSGRGIYTNGGYSGGNLTNVTIDANAFLFNYGAKTITTTLEAAIAFQTLAAGEQSNIRITNNMFDQNGKAVLFFNTDNVLIQGNLITYCRDLNSGAIRMEGGDTNITITGNTLYANPGNVLRIDTKGVPGSNNHISLTGNNIYSPSLTDTYKTYVMVDPGQYDGHLDATNNWWGTASGPGTTVQANNNDVQTSPFATAPLNIADNMSYLQAPWSTDGMIQVENFDHGGEGVSFHDLDSANLGQAVYRQPFGVDIQTTTDTGGGYNIGYVKAGEWLTYTMDIAAAGTYNLDVRLAYSSSGGKFHFELDGQDITGTMTMPNTGGTQTWKTITKTGVVLPAGRHVLRLVMDANGSGGSVGNFNWFAFRNTNPNPPPASPSNLVATLQNSTTVALGWQDNSLIESGFIIERKIGDGAWTMLTTTAANVTSYVDSNLSANTTYTYRVRATNASGDSPNSNEAALTTPNAGQTSYLSDLPWVSATNGWGPVEKDMSVGGSNANDGGTLTLNGVTYAKGLGVNSVSDIVYNLAGEWNTFMADVGVDDHQTVNGSVVFQVFADGVKIYDSAAMGPDSATQSINVDVTGVQQLVLHVDDGGDGNAYDWADWAGARVLTSGSQVPLQPPSASGNLNANPISATRIDLTWSDVAGETGYRVERSTDGVTFSPVGTTQAGVTSYSDTTVAANTTYSYRVIATNSAGDSAPSNVAQATTPALPTPPGAPTSLVATLVNYQRIDLSWADNSSNETGFIVERSTDGVTFTQIATPGANATTYSDTSNLALSTTYTYRVRATNAAGDSDNSNLASATTPATAPAPVAANNLVASAISSSRIDLVWQDNATNETNYKIERSSDGVNFTLTATIGANSTNYSDTTLTANTQYWYRVRATNAGGDSDPSNVATATTSPLSGLPDGWTGADVGPVGLSGNTTYNNGTYTLQGAGADIYNNSDAFQFACTQLSGDGTIIARVASLTNTDANSKAGIMIRDTLAANAKEASVVVTPSNGIKFLRRTSTGGSTSSTTVSSLKAPMWLKLVRSGSTFTSYYSTNGTSWTLIGSQTISMGTTVYIGLAVTAHKTTALATGTFDNVSIG